jgi:hypothetical protein
MLRRQDEARKQEPALQRAAAEAEQNRIVEQSFLEKLMTANRDTLKTVVGCILEKHPLRMRH